MTNAKIPTKAELVRRARVVHSHVIDAVAAGLGGTEGVRKLRRDRDSYMKLARLHNSGFWRAIP